MNARPAGPLLPGIAAPHTLVGALTGLALCAVLTACGPTAGGAVPPAARHFRDVEGYLLTLARSTDPDSINVSVESPCH